MFTLTFNPGPSQLSAETKQDIRDAIDANVPEISHRGDAFTDISRATIAGLRQFMGIPDDYCIFYTASATDAMDLVIRNLVESASFHFVSGNFSELFAMVARQSGRKAVCDTVPVGEQNRFADATVPPEAEIITVPYSETSTCVMCSDENLRALRAAYPDPLLCVDITSVAGVFALPIAAADVWLFSVQKGLGLPAGLGLVIVSPRAMQKASRSRGKTAGYFAFGEMQELMATKCQTLNTPNVMNIFLLGRQLKRWNERGGISSIEKVTREKAHMFDEFMQKNESPFHYFVADPSVRSLSVFCLQAPGAVLERAHSIAQKKSILFGKGYGKMCSSIIRLANFPAIDISDMRRAIEILSETGAA